MRFTLVLLLVITQKHGQSVPVREISYNVHNSGEVDTEILHQYKVIAAQNSFDGMSKQFRVSGTEFNETRAPATKNVFTDSTNQFQGPDVEINKDLVLLAEKDLPGINQKPLVKQVKEPLDDPFYKNIQLNQESSTDHAIKQILRIENLNPGPPKEKNTFIGRISPNKKKSELQKNSVFTTESSSVDVNVQKKCIDYQKYVQTLEEPTGFILIFWQIIMVIYNYIICLFY